MRGTTDGVAPSPRATGLVRRIPWLQRTCLTLIGGWRTCRSVNKGECGMHGGSFGLIRPAQMQQGIQLNRSKRGQPRNSNPHRICQSCSVISVASFNEPYVPTDILANNSSLVLCFLSAAVSVSIASMGFKSTIVRRSLRMASRFFAGNNFSSLRVPLLGMSIADTNGGPTVCGREYPARAFRSFRGRRPPSQPDGEWERPRQQGLRPHRRPSNPPSYLRTPRPRGASRRCSPSFPRSGGLRRSAA